MLILDLKKPCRMDTEAIVIRIKTPSGDMDSSVDCPSLLNFNDLLVSVYRATELAVTPGSTSVTNCCTVKEVYSLTA